MLHRVALAVAILLAGLAGAAPAAPAASAPSTTPARAIALVSLEVAGNASDELRAQIAGAVEQAVNGAGARYVRPDAAQAAIAERPELAGCVSISCLQALAAGTGAGELLRVHVAASGNSYDIDVELLAPDAEGGLAGRVQRSCSVCSVTDLQYQVALATGDLLAGRGDAPGVPVEIVCDPPGAEIVIDDEPRGAAPFRGRLLPGPHRVLARLDGHASSVRVIEVEPDAGEQQRFQVALAPSAALDAGRRPYRRWKWIAAGGAGAALVTGTVLLALHGGGTCGTERDACPEEYDTRGAGLVGLAVGLLAGGASAWMFLQDRDER